MPRLVKWTGGPEPEGHSPDYLRRQLPPIGHRTRKRLYMGHDKDELRPMVWCEVIYVNYENLFYRVRFSGCGITESYKAV